MTKVYLTWWLGAALAAGGCAGVAAKPDQQAVGEKLSTTSAVAHEKAKQSDDIQRLTRLWEQRQKKSGGSDYPIGPGDVIELNVPGMDEIKNMSERINGDGTITLPFAGVIKANGMTERQLRDEIRRRLEEKYMRNPQVNLFVKEFRSRQVAVIGAVQKPGLYNLASYSDTLLNMISQAGGMKPEASESILFVPAEPANAEEAKKVVQSMPSQLVRQDPSPLILKNVEPIVISLDSIHRIDNERFLQMPARAGDIIMVPGGGEVLVQGWVEKPGSFKITPGLTVLGAVAAAGGAMFPANTGSVEVIRTDKNGQKTSFVADLDSIKSGAQPDLAVREGDVIDVSSSSPKLVAYGVYRFFTSIMSVGASIPLR
ncbi:MAG: polysaccharide biosynthesis/export family protein [Chloroflexota bacterium]